ncbi:MAG: glycosyltransferase family 2 protein [Candidatus Saccharimonadales bacterium]
MKKPKISIITPAYNAERYIAETIQSVQAQSFTEYEHIVIDDGSHDTTATIVKEYAKADKRIIYLKQKNKGPSAARNKGLKKAKGMHIIFLDADDSFAPDTLSTLSQTAATTDADIIFYDYVYYIDNKNLGWSRHHIELDQTKTYSKEDLSDKIFNVFPILTCNKLIKKQVLSGGKISFDTTYARNEDVDFSIRVTLAAETYAYVDYIGYYYRVSNPDSETATNFKHPTQLLQILANLNELILIKHPNLKQSFDNYAIEQMIGSVSQQEPHPQIHHEVFDFVVNKTMPSIGLDNVQPDYLYNPALWNAFSALQDKNYPGILFARVKTLKEHTAWLEGQIVGLENELKILKEAQPAD